MTLERLAYSRAEAAKALCLSERTVRTMTETGELPSFRVGRRVLISRKALEAWIDARPTVTTPV